MKKRIKKVMILLCGFMLFMNTTLVLANNNAEQDLESFRYYYNGENVDYSFKSFISSNEYKALKNKSGNSKKTDTDLYVEYYLGLSNGSDQAVKNFYMVLSDESFDLDKLSTEEYNFAVDMAISLYGHEGTLEQRMGNTGAIDFNKGMKVIKKRIEENKKYNNVSEEKKDKLNQGSNNTQNSSDVSKGEGKTETTTEKNDTIYQQPIAKDNKTAGSTLDDMMSDAEKFIEKGKTKGLNNLPSVSNTIYNILLTVGIIIAVLVGAILGIKLMVSGIEEKAEVKKLLVSYVAGCIIIFGGFGIWKIVVTILQTV